MSAIEKRSADAVIEADFLAHRAKLIDLAAFLDRVERAAPGAVEDFRMSALRSAIRILSDGEPDRARRTLEALSDPTTEPVAAAGEKGACGAWPGRDRA